MTLWRYGRCSVWILLATLILTSGLYLFGAAYYSQFDGYINPVCRNQFGHRVSCS